MVNVANENGINLAESFATVDEFKSFVVNFIIAFAVKELGLDIQAAWDVVYGAGAYDAFAENLYNELQAQ